MTDQIRRWDTLAIRVLWGFTLIAIAGFATFGRHPELLERFPSVAWMYGHAFRLFASGQVWVAMIAIAFFLTRSVGSRWLASFAILYLVSLSSELTGTSTGFPFGDYEYTSLMQPQWFGRVPIVIPLSWFYMALASWAIAGRWVRTRPGRILVGAAVLASWDLALDPAMSYATRYWTWGVEGGYYGMPLVNLLGWFATGLILMTALAALRTDRWVDALPFPWIASFYLANLVLPIGMNAAAGLWGAVALSLAVAAAGWWLLRQNAPESRREPEVAPSALEAV